MRRMYEHILEKMEKSVYNMPEKRVSRAKVYLYGFPGEIRKEIKKEVFSI